MRAVRQGSAFSRAEGDADTGAQGVRREEKGLLVVGAAFTCESAGTGWNYLSNEVPADSFIIDFLGHHRTLREK